MIITTGFQQAREAADAVQRVAQKDKLNRLTGIPFNRFEPSESRWWLSPSGENPAFKFGKVAFDGGEPLLGDLFLGLYVEKGVGPEATAPFEETAYGRRFIMLEDWIWPEFFEAVVQGEFDPQLREAEVAGGLSVTIALEAMKVLPPTSYDWDIHGADLPRDLLIFKSRGGVLREATRQDRSAHVLDDLASSKSISTLFQQLGQLEILDSLWINFYCGFRLSQPANPANYHLWNAEKMYAAGVKPWAGWLR